MPDEATIKRIVQAVREKHRQLGAYDSALWTRHAVRPLTGGMNNAAYALTINGAACCLKLYKVDQRDRAQREWLALTFLADRSVRSCRSRSGSIPRPICPPS